MINHAIIVAIAVILAICVVIQFIIGSIKTIKIKELEEDLSKDKDAFQKERDLINLCYETSEKKLVTMIQNQETSYNDLHRKFFYAIYLLHLLDKEWFNRLRVVDTESITCPALRLTATNGNYNVYNYSKQEVINDKIKFLIDTKGDDFIMLSDILGSLQNASATSNKLPNLSTLITNINNIKKS
jgi:hypothetical protein